MDADRFDTLARSLTVGGSRRRVLGMLSGVTLGGLAPLLRLADAEAGKGKKDNGKDKKKGCPKGKKKCGKKCISKKSCCTYVDCTGCRNEDCINGKCQCNPELIMHNGICGFFINCKGFGETCVDHEECCGPSCVDGKCTKSIYHCISDNDCLSGPCQGFVCPEGHEPYFELCRP